MIFRAAGGTPRAKRGIASIAVISAALLAGLMTAFFIGTGTTQADVTCMANPLGAAAPYNEFVDGNGTRGSESEGAIAYGGNLNASSMTIGSRLSSSTAKSFPSVVVDGTDNGGFNIQAGSAYIGDLASGNINFNGGGSRLSSAPINFTSAFQTLEANSTTWGAATPNGTYQVIAPGADGTPAMGGTGSLLLSGTDPTLDIFTVPASEFDNTNLGQVFIQVPTGATALINVTGTSATFPVGVEYWNGSSFGQADNFSENTTGNAVENTVWNFPQATGTINLATGSAWGGTIVAPWADVDATAIGHNDGAVIANSFQSNFETHDYLVPSTACLPAAPAPTGTTTSGTTTSTSGTTTTTTSGTTTTTSGTTSTTSGTTTTTSGTTTTTSGTTTTTSGTTTTTGGGTPASPADLQVTKTANESAVHPGDDVTYTLTVSNSGSGAATNVVLADLLPAGMTFVSADSGCYANGQTVDCDAGTVAPGASESFKITTQAQAVSAPLDQNDQLSAVKQEAYISIPAGQTTSTDLSCGSGMIATDASVEVVHVDQGTGTLSQVEVQSLTLQPDGSYQALVDNTTTGQAQAEMYVTCINGTTTDGHQVIVGNNVTNTTVLTAGTHTILVQCGSGRTPIAPSFAVLSGQASLEASVPDSDSDRLFTVDVGSGGADVLAGMRCMSDTTGESGGTVTELETNIVSEQVTVPAGADVPEQLSCGDQQKGIVGGWDFGGNGLITLGNEPQPKIRVFWVDNPTNAALTGTLYLVCMDERTGAASGQATLVNTVNVTTDTPQSAGSVDSASATVTVDDSGTSSTGTGDPVIIVDPPASDLPLTLSAHRLMLHGRRMVVPVRVKGHARGWVTLRTPHSLKLHGRTIAAHGRLARARFTLGHAGVVRVQVHLPAAIRAAMRAAHRHDLTLVLSGRVDGHARHVRVTLKLR